MAHAFVFDDLYPHEVWNNTDEERVVLLIDVERPMTFGAKSLNRAILWGFKQTSYVVEARRGVEAWEARLRARPAAPAWPAGKGHSADARPGAMRDTSILAAAPKKPRRKR